MAVTVEITPLRCGTIKAPAEVFETGATGQSTAPVYAFLISHPTQPPLLFDTGLHPDMDGVLHLGAYANTVPAGQDVAGRLKTLGVERLGGVVLSHAHYDHAGGLPLIADVPVFAHRDEDLSPIDPTRDIRRTDDGFDLFGDGSAELFATPGHTPGHQSLRVRRFGGYDVLAGDACYFCRSLTRQDADQPYAADKPAFIASKQHLARLQAEGGFVIPGHDESFLDAIPRASTVRPQSVSWD